MFRDGDLVAIYQTDIHIDHDTHVVVQDKVMDHKVATDAINLVQGFFLWRL
jgi:hypothetical protein